MSTYTSNPQGTGSGQMESSGAKEEIQHKAEDVKVQAKEKAQDLMGTAQERARESLSTGKSKATSELHTVATALHRAGEQLDNENDVAVAQYAHQIADKLDDFSSVISDKSVDELVNEVERFGREKPEVFLGAAFALGLIAARFLKSSRDVLERSPEQMAYGSQQFTSTTDYPATGTTGVTGTTGMTGMTGTTGTTGAAGIYGTGTSSTSTAGYGTKGGAASETDETKDEFGEGANPTKSASNS